MGVFLSTPFCSPMSFSASVNVVSLMIGGTEVPVARVERRHAVGERRVRREQVDDLQRQA